MNAIITCGLNKFIEYIKKKHGYQRHKRGHGYIKNIHGGRLHITFFECTNQTLFNLHYDKFKGKKNKKYNHKSRYSHPYVQNEMKQILQGMSQL